MTYSVEKLTVENGRVAWSDETSFSSLEDAETYIKSRVSEINWKYGQALPFHVQYVEQFNPYRVWYICYE